MVSLPLYITYLKGYGHNLKQKQEIYPMNELDHFVVANAAKIPCTVRTLKPYWNAGDLKPWVHSGEISDAILYLAVRAGFPDDETHALKELLERLSSSLSALSDSGEVPPDEKTGTNEQ